MRALLNNLERRVDSYAKWLGRTAAVRHGDTAQGVRRRLAVDRPDILMTTPESIEAMLVSTTLDPRVLLGVDAMRRVLLGTDPVGVQLSSRAVARLEGLRDEWQHRVDPGRTVLLHESDATRWWTWAGGRTNALLRAALDHVAPEICDPISTFTNDHVVLRGDTTGAELRAALAMAREEYGDDLSGVEPEISDRAIQDLKFSDMLPRGLAVRTLASRVADHPHAASAAAVRVVEVRSSTD